ncbi:MAG: glycosyltransferase [Pirellulales bacterium]
MTRRILLIAAEEDQDGARSLSQLAAGLPRADFDVHICLLVAWRAHTPATFLANAEYTTIERNWAIDPRLWWRLRQHIARLRPEIVQTWERAGSLEMRTAARSAGVKLVVAAGLDLDAKWTWLERTIERRLARLVRAIVVPGEAARQECVARGLDARRLHVIPPAETLAPAPAQSRASALAEIGLPAGARVIAVVSPLVRSARLKDLIWSFDLVRLARNDAHLMLIGDGPEQRSLEDFAASQEAHNHVHFTSATGGWPDWFGHVDLAWIHQAREQPPRSVLGAMARGVPVLAGDSPGVREAMHDGQEGLVVSRERAALARATLDLLDDAPRRTRLVAAARERIVNHFSPSLMVERHVAMYAML